MKWTTCTALCAIAVALLLSAANSFADPLANEVPKFIQLPLNSGGPIPLALPAGSVQGAPAPFPGHDELSTAYLNPNGTQFNFDGTYMADDFSDTVSSPVVHITWWGSYMNNAAPTINPVRNFLVSFESDVPASSTNGTPSHPGVPLLNQIVTVGALAPQSGTFTETFVPTPGVAPESLFQYNAELKVPFAEQANVVYWLKIVALDDAHAASTQPGAIQWGWHNRDYGIRDNLAATAPAVVPGEFDESFGAPNGPVWHFQDDAVQGPVNLFAPVPLTMGQIPTSTLVQSQWIPQNYHSPFDGPAGLIDQYSKDLAFVLYYNVPEPSSLVLLGVGLAGMVAAARRRRRA